MEENFKNKIGLSLFIFVILFLLIGGYFFKDYILNDHKKIEEEKKNNVSYKIDESKDYIYYGNESVISEDAEIDYVEVFVNIKNHDVISEGLNREAKMYKENIKLISDQTNLIEDAIHYSNNNIYAMTFKRYQNYEYGKFVSLISNDFNYDCMEGVTIKSVKTYVFNINNGSLMTKDELLKEFETTEEAIKEKVREYLTNKNTTEGNTVQYNIEETINNIDMNNLFVSEFGKLRISYIAKTSQVDYNEITEV